jgi:predicted AAA+ superfamily ATPase
VVNELHGEGLRIIEVRKDQLCAIPKILDELANNPLKFILFIDDLSFLRDDDNFNALKAVLEGSVSAKSRNVVIYATSNRRHIIKEKFSDREGDDVHRNETLQELISLSERFGIHITFGKPTKQTYLHIVKHLATNAGIVMEEKELELLAERFALARGGRSARLARQFVDGLISAKTE